VRKRGRLVTHFLYNLPVGLELLLFIGDVIALDTEIFAAKKTDLDQILSGVDNLCNEPGVQENLDRDLSRVTVGAIRDSFGFPLFWLCRIFLS
jgi:hypothetical protein